MQHHSVPACRYVYLRVRAYPTYGMSFTRFTPTAFFARAIYFVVGLRVHSNLPTSTRR